ncbi:MAG: phosphatidate cytidylyltransferase [Spirochaetales bacterium]|nr:phosphatidate cytidylyltransferase [Spirochaetales bacterium]
MSNLKSRLILTAIFIPGLFVAIFFLPFLNHLVFNLMVIIVIFLASQEICGMFQGKGISTWPVFAPLLAASYGAAVYAESTGFLIPNFSLYWLIGIITIIFMAGIIVRDEKKMNERLPLLASTIFVIVYPGILLSFITRISTLQEPSATLLLFIAAIFANDIAAYLAGRFFGRGKALKLPISPKKTLIGFIAGFIASIGIVLAAAAIFPWAIPLSLWKAITLGAILGVLGIIGDLFESALKRSSEVKDSGVLMGGRGGLMDAIDSLLPAAPVFFYLYPLLTAGLFQ